LPVAKALKSKVRNLEMRFKPTTSSRFGVSDFLNIAFEDLPSPQTMMTEQEKENVVRERVKGYIKRNWKDMSEPWKNAYMAKFASLGLVLNGELIEEAKPTEKEGLKAATISGETALEARDSAPSGESRTND